MTLPIDRTTLDHVRDGLQLVLALTDAEAAAVTLQTTPVTLPRWTSLTHLQLILELERRCAVMFDADDIASLASVGSLVETIERLKAPAR